MKHSSFLFNTSDKAIVEALHDDKIGGIGLVVDDENAENHCNRKV